MDPAAELPAAEPASPRLPPLYAGFEVVTAERHGALRLAQGGGYGFASGAGALPVVTEEFSLIGRRFPIVFSAQPPHLPVILLRLRDGADGGGEPWGEGRYVPAYLRRYPFLLASTGAGSDALTLCLDPSAPLLGREEGVALYEPGGTPSAALRQAFAFALELEAAFRRTRAFTDRLAALSLLVPSTARLPGAGVGGEALEVTGFCAVDRAALARLPGEELAALRDGGHLEAIYAHLVSIHAMGDLPLSQPG